MEGGGENGPNLDDIVKNWVHHVFNVAMINLNFGRHWTFCRLIFHLLYVVRYRVSSNNVFNVASIDSVFHLVSVFDSNAVGSSVFHCVVFDFIIDLGVVDVFDCIVDVSVDDIFDCIVDVGVDEVLDCAIG